jgi:ABC-type multidrug transport system ATPase subunit
MGTAFIEVTDLVKQYRSRDVAANDGICFTAEAGEIVALLGPNGAGKTTFILQLLGLVVPTSGSIFVGDIDVVAAPARVKRIASYQPQGHMAMAGVAVRQALVYTGQLRGLGSAEARRQAAALAAEFELDSVLTKPLQQLSGGWRRLVDIAVAFIGTPRLIVLDEPTNDLDPSHRRLVWEKLNALRESRAVTCLIVTHNLLEAERIVDRAVIMNRGRCVTEGTPGAIKQLLGEDTLRLDIYLRLEAVSSDLPLAMASLGPAEVVRPGHLRFFFPRDRAFRAMELLSTEDARAWLDDFRLAPPSLEDVYLQLSEVRHDRVLA